MVRGLPELHRDGWCGSRHHPSPSTGLCRDRCRSQSTMTMSVVLANTIQPPEKPRTSSAWTVKLLARKRADECTTAFQCVSAATFIVWAATFTQEVKQNEVDHRVRKDESAHDAHPSRCRAEQLV